MANKNLILGAKTAYGDSFVDAGEAIGSAASSYTSGISPSTLANLASMKNTDAQVKAYVDSLNTEMDLLELSSAEQNSIKGYLNTQKNLYASLATELAQIDPISEEYVNIKNRMDGIKQSFLNLKNQTDKFKERKIQYLDDLNNGRLSKGNKAEDYNKAGSVYGGGALLIDPEGGINVVTDGGKNFIKYTEVKDPFLKDFKTADEILEQNNKLYNAGVKLDPSKEALLRNQLKSKLSQDGSLESIVEDGLINNQRLNVDLDTYATREEAIDDVAEILLQGYRDSAAAGAEEKRIKQKNLNKSGNKNGNSNTINDPEGTYSGYGRNTEADKENFKTQYNNVSNRAAKDHKGITLIDENGNVDVEGSKTEERSIKWYSSATSKIYQGRVPRGGYSDLVIRPVRQKGENGAIYSGVQYKTADGEWKWFYQPDFEAELNGTAGVTQTNTNTSTSGVGSRYNDKKKK
jgi:hypothetical protein